MVAKHTGSLLLFTVKFTELVFFFLNKRVYVLETKYERVRDREDFLSLAAGLGTHRACSQSASLAMKPC